MWVGRSGPVHTASPRTGFEQDRWITVSKQGVVQASVIQRRVVYPRRRQASAGLGGGADARIGGADEAPSSDSTWSQPPVSEAPPEAARLAGRWRHPLRPCPRRGDPANVGRTTIRLPVPTNTTCPSLNSPHPVPQSSAGLGRPRRVWAPMATESPLRRPERAASLTSSGRRPMEPEPSSGSRRAPTTNGPPLRVGTSRAQSAGMRRRSH